jgi:hypothetical protein
MWALSNIVHTILVYISCIYDDVGPVNNGDLTNKLKTEKQKYKSYLVDCYTTGMIWQ